VSEGKEGFPAAFREVIAEMARLYEDTERQFLSFNRIIPYSHNPGEVYSPRLYTILQSCSAQIISMMDSLTSFLFEDTFHSRSRRRQKTFGFYYERLNKEGMLSVQKLAPKEKVTMIITPFKVSEGVTPRWWQAYNDTKHDLPHGAYIGTLENVLNALGALTILHDICQWIFRTSARNSILRKENWKDKSNDFVKDYEYIIDPNSLEGQIMAETIL
jgi:hypothetical protein